MSVSRVVNPRCSISAEEGIGEQQTARRVLPAHERLDGDRGTAARVALGLVMQDELPAFEGAVEVLAGLQALAAVALERGREALGPGAPPLGLVHREVGVTQQRGQIGASPLGDADARADPQRDPTDLQRLADPLTAAAPPPGWSSASEASTSANSSPPRRAIRSAGCARDVSRRATSRSRASPASCPSASLISLKPSRSTSSSAHVSPPGVLVQRAPVGEAGELVRAGLAAGVGEPPQLVERDRGSRRGQRQRRHGQADGERGHGPPVAHNKTPTAAAVETSGTASTAAESRRARGGSTGRQSASAMTVMPIDQSASSGVPIA